MSKPSKTIDEKRRELDELLAWFESDDFKLEEAIEKFESASKLADEITAELDEYKNKIEVLTRKFE